MAKTKPSHTFRLQSMSVPELTEGLVKARLRLNRAGLLHRGRKLKDGPLLNAIVAWYLSLPLAEQDRIAGEGLMCFEDLIDGRALPCPEDRAEAAARTLSGDAPLNPPVEPPRRRRGAAGA